MILVDTSVWIDHFHAPVPVTLSDDVRLWTRDQRLRKIATDLRLTSNLV